jgi:hypothetical protein
LYSISLFRVNKGEALQTFSGLLEIIGMLEVKNIIHLDMINILTEF